MELRILMYVCDVCDVCVGDGWQVSKKTGPLQFHVMFGSFRCVECMDCMDRMYGPMIGRYLPTSNSLGCRLERKAPFQITTGKWFKPPVELANEPYNLIATDNALANAEADADRFHYVVAIGMRIIKAFAWMHQQLQK